MGVGKLHGSKHYFLETLIAGCTTCDIIALGSGMTWSNFCLLKVAQKMHHKLCKISAVSAHQFGIHFRKKRGGLLSTIPARAIVTYFSVRDFLKIGTFTQIYGKVVTSSGALHVRELNRCYSLVCSQLLGCQMCFW